MRGVKKGSEMKMGEERGQNEGRREDGKGR